MHIFGALLWKAKLFCIFEMGGLPIYNMEHGLQKWVAIVTS
jgi:hypothetical protein